MNWIAPAVVAASVVALAALVGRDGPPPPVPLLVRLIAILVVAGTAAVLDDPAQPSIAASPVPLAVRRAIRIGLGWVTACGTWAVAVAVLLARFDVSGFSAGRAALEFAAMLAVMTAGAGVALALGHGSGFPAGSTATMAFAFGMIHLPARFSLVVAPAGTPAFDHETLRWTIVLAVMLAAIAWHMRDPARARARV